LASTQDGVPREARECVPGDVFAAAPGSQAAALATAYAPPPHAAPWRGSAGCFGAAASAAGTCLAAPLHDGHACDDAYLRPCYLAPAPASTAGGACAGGFCTGARCAGTCQDAQDCPTLQVRGVARHASCIWHTCVYSE